MVYAHQAPSIRPMVSTIHVIIPHSRPWSTQSSRPPAPDSMAPMAMENGTDTITSPVICMGGWMNIPKWTSSGFIP